MGLRIFIAKTGSAFGFHPLSNVIVKPYAIAIAFDKTLLPICGGKSHLEIALSI